MLCPPKKSRRPDLGFILERKTDPWRRLEGGEMGVDGVADHDHFRRYDSIPFEHLLMAFLPIVSMISILSDWRSGWIRRGGESEDKWGRDQGEKVNEHRG